MAGGPHASEVMCPTCFLDESVVTKAVRLSEGVETDQYRCERGHLFGIDWSRGAATKPQWPPPEMKDDDS